MKTNLIKDYSGVNINHNKWNKLFKKYKRKWFLNCEFVYEICKESIVGFKAYLLACKNLSSKYLFIHLNIGKLLTTSIFYLQLFYKQMHQRRSL